jgi:hypothetical protein
VPGAVRLKSGEGPRTGIGERDVRIHYDAIRIDDAMVDESSIGGAFLRSTPRATITLEAAANNRRLSGRLAVEAARPGSRGRRTLAARAKASTCSAQAAVSETPRFNTLLPKSLASTCALSPLL